MNSIGLVKEMNRLTVLNLIKEGPVSRSEIAERSGLSATSVSNITAELLDDGLIAETGTVGTPRGRPRVTLELQSDARLVVGVKVMPDTLHAVLTDLEATVVAEETIDIEHPAGFPVTPGRLVGALASLVSSIVESEPGADDRLLGVGLGLAGVIDSARGVCRYSPFFDWHDIDLVTPLREATGFDVYLENDVNSLTLAEKWFGHGLGRPNFAVMTIGQGVGVGLVVNDQFYGGSAGGVGEIGHIQVLPDGPVCTCGRQGCLEALAGDRGVIDHVATRLSEGEVSSLSPANLDIDAISRAAAAGDPVAVAALNRSGEWLGVGLTTLVNLINPELVIIAGEGVGSGDHRLGPMRDALNTRRFDSLGPDIEMVVEQAGDQAWARGAACVVLSEFFRSPLPVARSRQGVGA